MAKGKKTGGGSRKGVPNKVSTTVKDNVIAVFHAIGGTQTMQQWAKENQTEFFKLYAKLIPTQIDLEATIKPADISSEPMTPEQWAEQHAGESIN
jgi:hypothetical protein